jgi:uncharacterized protein
LTDDLYVFTFKNFMKEQDHVCVSHDFTHAYQVMKNTLMGMKEESLTTFQKEAVMLAGLLHDADDQKFFPQNHNNENVRHILFDKHKEFVDLVIEMIDLVSSSVNGDRMVEDEWKLIPRYADRIEALGIIGIKRCYEYTKTINNPLIQPDTEKPTDYDQIWEIASNNRYIGYRGKSKSMIDHYYDKLLRLGDFPIKNIQLKEMAASKINIMIKFVLDFCDLHKSLCSDENNDSVLMNKKLDQFINSFIELN